MKLKNYCRLRSETEVNDSAIDVRAPYYNENGTYCFMDTEQDHYLHLMETWMLNLTLITDIEDELPYSVCVPVFYEVKDNWKTIVKGMQEVGGYDLDFSDPDLLKDQDAMADYAEDVFTCLSQGFYSFAKDFCLFFGLEKKFNRDIAQEVIDGKIQVVDISDETFGNLVYNDEIELIRIPELDDDLSQGTGNVVIYHYFVPDLDIVVATVSF